MVELQNCCPCGPNRLTRAAVAGSGLRATRGACDPGKDRRFTDTDRERVKRASGPTTDPQRSEGEGGVLLVQLLPRDAALRGSYATVSAADRSVKAGL